MKYIRPVLYCLCRTSTKVCLYLDPSTPVELRVCTSLKPMVGVRVNHDTFRVSVQELQKIDSCCKLYLEALMLISYMFLLSHLLNPILDVCLQRENLWKQLVSCVKASTSLQKYMRNSNPTQILVEMNCLSL